MPIIPASSFRPSFLFRNGHLQTIIPTLAKKNPDVRYRRERIATPDNDVLDLDWAETGSDQLAILSHGLEGSAARWYMRGMARSLNRAGWDALPWNFRGCAGEMNRTLRFYHSGATDDLATVIAHVKSLKRYRRIALIGFSLGGNMTLKYLGEQGRAIDPAIIGAVAFSVPCDLKTSAIRLALPSNSIYMRRFIKTLAEKVREKSRVMPELDASALAGMRTFQQFDDRYTAPLHGFRDAEDYWARCSSRGFLDAITIPTLIVNAVNDPFLSPECYPIAEARRSSFVSLEMPASGGHVGFMAGGDRFWMGERALSFLAEC
ncbi:MAG: alpha/beta fold hydrolase [Candidatus Kapaibacterium sp.]